MFVENEMNFVIDENHCYGTTWTAIRIQKYKAQTSSCSKDWYDSDGRPWFFTDNLFHFHDNYVWKQGNEIVYAYQ